MSDPVPQGSPIGVIRKALQRAGAKEGYTVPGITTPLGNFIPKRDAEQTPFKKYREADSLAALAVVEQLVAAARPALELLASEGYDRHCGEYENLRAALLPFDGSGKEPA